MGFKDNVRRRLKNFLADEPEGTQSTATSRGVDQPPWGKIRKKYQESMERALGRKAKYEEYAYLGKNLAEGSSALNIYADNIISGSFGGEENYSVFVDEKTPQMKKIEDIIIRVEEQSRIKDHVWEIARDLTEFGDNFQETIISQHPGVPIYYVKLKKLPPATMFADVDSKGEFKNPRLPYIQKANTYDDKGIPFEWWRIIHFKIGQGIYGVDRSLFADAARRIGRQLLWIDESMVIARLSRAWQRFAYLVDTTGLNPEEKWDFVDRFMENFMREEIIDQETGKISVSDKPPMPDEDIAIPVSKDSKQDIKVLTGDFNIGNIEDVKYFQNKFFMSVSVPKAYMALEEGTKSKATLTQIDVQFARQVRRRQSNLVPGLREYYRLVFILNDIDPDSFKWDIVFPELATTDELIKWEIEKTKAEIAKIYGVDIGCVNDDYIYYEILGLTKKQVKKYKPDFDTPPPAQGIEPTLNIPPDIAKRMRRDPQVRQIVSDLQDLIQYKIAHDQSMEGLKAVDEVKREKSLKDLRDEV
jgi:hypothetical protein